MQYTEFIYTNNVDKLLKLNEKLCKLPSHQEQQQQLQQQQDQDQPSEDEGLEKLVDVTLQED